MKYFISLMSGVAALALAGQAQAQILEESTDEAVYVNFGHSYTIPALTHKYNDVEVKHRASLRRGSHNALIRAGYRAGVFGFEVEAKLNNDTVNLHRNGPTVINGSLLSNHYLVTKYKMAYQLGAFATASISVSENFQVHGRIGGLFGRANIETFAEREYDLSGEKHFMATEVYGPLTMKQNIFSLALGVGAQYNFDEKSGVRLDYTYQISKKLKKKYEGYEADNRIQGHSLSIAYVRTF